MLQRKLKVDGLGLGLDWIIQFGWYPGGAMYMYNDDDNNDNNDNEHDVGNYKDCLQLKKIEAECSVKAKVN